MSARLKELSVPVVALWMLMSPQAHALDLASMGAQDLRALQQRLADAKCYAGAINGTRTAALDEALKRCPSMDPALAIETGMHVATIKRIGVDRNCRLLATGSDDKTVRLWSLPDGQLLRTLRLPVGPGHAGKVFAAALTSDGRTVAAAGWDAQYDLTRRHGVSLFDTSSGALTARMGALDSVINHLAFSADGRYLAAVLGAGQGVRVLEVSTGREVAADKNYGAAAYGVAFAADGRLFTTSDDGSLRAYDRSFRLTRKVATRGGKEPYSVALDPSGERLAVGFNDSTRVEVYRAADLSLLFEANTTGISGGDLSKVGWSADGKRLVAGGRHGGGQYPLVVWRTVAAATGVRCRSRARRSSTSRPAARATRLAPAIRCGRCSVRTGNGSPARVRSSPTCAASVVTACWSPPTARAYGSA